MILPTRIEEGTVQTSRRRLVPLMREFGKLVADHAAFRELFGLVPSVIIERRSITHLSPGPEVVPGSGWC